MATAGPHAGPVSLRRGAWCDGNTRHKTRNKGDIHAEFRAPKARTGRFTRPLTMSGNVLTGSRTGLVPSLQTGQDGILPSLNAVPSMSPIDHPRTAVQASFTARRAGLPVVRILHTDGPNRADNPFSPASGLVRPLDGLVEAEPARTVEKHRHSALVGTGLGEWLRTQRITRLIVAGIRTEPCGETTARHASDEGWEVDDVTEAPLTFDMPTPTDKRLSAAQIRERTETVLSGRFATLCTVGQALARAAAPEGVTP